ncbi:MAG TPA: hypothetical protein VLH79_06090 [Chthonomonadales bacterium]|nr:hypothetical protein [Chthonomonadales bacterium]
MTGEPGPVVGRPVGLDGLTDEVLAQAGLRDLPRARRTIIGLAGQGVTDDEVEALLPALLHALSSSPDPDRGLVSLARWTESVTNRITHFRLLADHPAALRMFFEVCGVSQFFSDILTRNPEYFEIIANPRVRSSTVSSARLYRELSLFVDGIVRPELKLEAMRRFRHREVLRIGVRDILGIADLAATAREFSHLADVCIQKALEIAVADVKSLPSALSVIGMGKLGGRELNYSSDIDLIFVCCDEGGEEGLRRALRTAELVVSALSRNLQHGHLFRVDVRLRPEGRFGPLVRTLSSYAAYYESWAEPWEFQALVKARPVAGDAALGRRFMDMVAPMVFRRRPAPSFLDAVRRNKERIEQKAALDGVSATNVKVGRGGIRDIEFMVQLLQLTHGGQRPELRAAGTLDALERLHRAGLLRRVEASELREDYCFLRTVEHRLQILYDLQTQALPAEPEERRLLARRMGYAGSRAFDREYQRRTDRVRAHFERLFLQGGEPAIGATDDPWRGPLQVIETDSARDVLVELLRSRGFVQPELAYKVLRGALAGVGYGRTQPEAAERLIEIAPALIDACSRSGDPDAALAAVEGLMQAVPNRGAMYATLAQSGEIMDRLCRLAAGGPALVRNLARHLEWLDLLVSEEVVDPDPKPLAAALGELRHRLRGVKGDQAFWSALAVYIQRERLRIGARDLWGAVRPARIGEELTALAEAVVQVLLERAATVALASSHSQAAVEAVHSVAVIGLGKLGGREVGYGSDWDILVAYMGDRRGVEGRAFASVNLLVETLLGSVVELRTRGAPVEIDARLRPEGRFGALARTVEEYGQYYRDAAGVWERQALIKARPVAGCPETASAYVAMVRHVVYGRVWTEREQHEVRDMKRRIEAERLRADQRSTDLKLGHGGMSDIEFLAQLLQLRHGATREELRVTGTVDALHALAGAGVLRAAEAMRLADTYERWVTVRNRLALLGESATDSLPDDVARLRNVAIGLGYADSNDVRAEDALRRSVDDRMRESRALFERHFMAGGHDEGRQA